MKYVLVQLGRQYVRDFNESDYYFAFTRNVEEAKRFDSIAEIIQVLTKRSAKCPGFNTDYTIKGVKDVAVITTAWEEVDL